MIEEAGALPLGQYTSRDIWHNTYTYVLHLRCEDTILIILCTGVPITTAIAGKCLNSLTSHDDHKSIKANAKTIDQI